MEHLVTIVAITLSATVLTPAVKLVGNLWRAPLALRDERIATLLSDAGAKPKDLTVSHKMAEYGQRYSEWMRSIDPLLNDSQELDQVITRVDGLFDEVVQYIQSEPSLGNTYLYKFKSAFNAPETNKYRTPKDWSKEKTTVFIQVMANAERLTRIVNELSTEPTP